MKALITGVNGFVGPYLKNHLLDNDFKVYGTDISQGVDVDFKLDLLDKNKVEEIIKKIKPDLIFHLAAQSSVKLSFLQPDFTMKVNVQGTRNILQAVKINVPYSKILVVSSADVYGVSKEVPLLESSKLNPVSPYGESRVEQEKVALSYGLNLVISRSFPHTGPGQRPFFVCSSIAKQIAEIERGKEAILKVGDVTVKRDFSDVRDIVKAYLLALEKCKFNEIYNICSGRKYSIKQILDILLSFTNKKIQINVDSKRLRKKDIPILQGDNSKFVEATGWGPTIPIEKTLRDLLEYWRKYLNKDE